MKMAAVFLGAHPSTLFSTTDIDSTYKKMNQNGVEVDELMKLPYRNMFNFKDPGGNEYVIREDK